MGPISCEDHFGGAQAARKSASSKTRDIFASNAETGFRISILIWDATSERGGGVHSIGHPFRLFFGCFQCRAFDKSVGGRRDYYPIHSKTILWGNFKT